MLMIHLIEWNGWRDLNVNCDRNSLTWMCDVHTSRTLYEKRMRFYMQVHVPFIMVFMLSLQQIFRHY